MTCLFSSDTYGRLDIKTKTIQEFFHLSYLFLDSLLTVYITRHGVSAAECDAKTFTVESTKIGHIQSRDIEGDKKKRSNAFVYIVEL